MCAAQSTLRSSSTSTDELKCDADATDSVQLSVVFPPIVSVPTITSFHSTLESPCTVASPAIVALVPTFNAHAALRSACV